MGERLRSGGGNRVVYSEFECAMMPNSEKAELLTSLYDIEAPSLSSFAGYEGYSDEGIARDEAYVAEKEALFARKKQEAALDGKYIPDECDYHPRALEALMRFGIGAGGNWFENRSGDENAYASTPVPVTRFDDIFNKIDLVVQTTRPEEFCDEYRPERVLFGIDFTTSASPGEVRTKILKSTNDPAARLEAGEGQLRYLRAPDGDLRPVASLPRYTVGLSRPNIDGILDNVTVSTEGLISISPQTLTARHRAMILYEIYQQNKFFSEALIAKAKGREMTEREEAVLAGFENVDDFLHIEMDKAVSRVKPGAKTAELAEELRKQDRTFAQITATVEELRAEVRAGRRPRY